MFVSSFLLLRTRKLRFKSEMTIKTPAIIKVSIVVTEVRGAAVALGSALFAVGPDVIEGSTRNLPLISLNSSPDNVI